MSPEELDPPLLPLGDREHIPHGEGHVINGLNLVSGQCLLDLIDESVNFFLCGGVAVVQVLQNVKHGK